MCIADVERKSIKPSAAKIISAADRLEALLAAEMNEERAGLCRADQPALRAMFDMNAALFRRLAE